METLNYNIILRPEPEGGFTVFVPSLPGCITYGKTVAEAREMAEDAIKGYIYVLKKNGEPIPIDDNSIVASVRVRTSTKTKGKPRVYA